MEASIPLLQDSVNRVSGGYQVATGGVLDVDVASLGSNHAEALFLHQCSGAEPSDFRWLQQHR